MRMPILIFLFLAACGILCAQTVTIKKVELVGQKIIVHYDLDDSNPVHEYKLDLYASKDNYIAPLTKVTGDVGTEVKPGAGRKIEWAISEEYGPYKGKIALEIRGKVYIPIVKLQNFAASTSYKRGKSYNLNLKAGNTNAIHVELYKGSQRISGEMNHPNNGTYTLSVPHKAKPGKDYRVKITDSKNSEEIVYSPFFKVKPKVPLVVKLVLPALVIGGVAGALGGGGGTEKPGTKDIPLPGFPN